MEKVKAERRVNPQVKAPRSQDDTAINKNRKLKLDKPEPIKEKSVEAPTRVR